MSPIAISLNQWLYLYQFHHHENKWLIPKVFKHDLRKNPPIQILNFNLQTSIYRPFPSQSWLITEKKTNCAHHHLHAVSLNPVSPIPSCFDTSCRYMVRPLSKIRGWLWWILSYKPSRASPSTVETYPWWNPSGWGNNDPSAPCQIAHAPVPPLQPPRFAAEAPAAKNGEPVGKKEKTRCRKP